MALRREGAYRTIVFPVGKKVQGGHSAPPASQDASQEAQSGLTSWGPLWEEAGLTKQPELRSW